MPNDNLDMDSGETPLPRLKPPVVQSKAVKPLLYTAGVLLVLALGFGYYGWHVRGKRNGLQEAKTALEAGLKKKTAVHESCERDLTKKNVLAGKLPTCERDRDTAVAAKKKLENETLAGLEKRLKATKVELTDLRKAREKQETRLKAFRDLTAKFQAMISAGKIEVLVRDGNMLVKLPAGVLFAVAKADLSPDGERALMEVGVVLKKMGKRRFLIIGHTDNQPLRKSEHKNNWELSTARALTVTEFLIRVGMKPHNVIAAGRGEFDPVADNGTRPGRQKNRRIEIVLMPDLGDMPEIPVGLTKKPDKTKPNKKKPGKKK